jgi:hypothetical protein
MSATLKNLARCGALLLVPLFGCMADVGSDGGQSAELGEQAAELSFVPELPLRITPLEDPLGLGPAGERELKRVISSDLEYVRLFGHATPAGVDYGAGDKVVVYSAGLLPTDGYEASLVSATLVTEYDWPPPPVPRMRPRPVRRVRVQTRLAAPGVACEPAEVQTAPYTLGVINTLVAASEFWPTQVKRVDCGGRTCDDIECGGGMHCELQEVICVRAPCPPIPECVVDRDAPRCGGLVAASCAGLGECVDNPYDSCDPQHPTSPGADCGGLCVCTASESCAPGFVWDGSAKVCDCVRAGR